MKKVVMRKILVLILFIGALQGKSQLLVNVQLPPNGIVQKSQLWNLTVTNTGTTTLNIHVELTFTDLVNSMQVMSAATQTIVVPPGTSQLNNTLLQPIQYNVLSQSYGVDASRNGFLPLGDFEVCYSFMSHNSHVVDKIAEECQELVIEALSPPQLVFPYDQSVIETKYPQLSWLPPMPSNLFINLKYDLDIVEVFPNQSPSDAIQQNIPLFQQLAISGNAIQYPLSAPLLALNKQYAWRVTAKSSEVAAGQTETWVFSIKDFTRIDTLHTSELPFAKLKKDDRGGYAIFVNELKLDYLNENSDSTWNISIIDLSTPEKRIINLSMDSIPLKAGQNLIKYDVRNNSAFINKHLYLLEIINSRKESWRLRFELRKPEE